MSNFVVSSLPNYVQTNQDLLVKNFALTGGETRKRISIQTGVKKDAYLNLLDLAPVLKSGAECGFTAGGTATLSQRTISTAPISVNMDICPKTLRGKYAEYLVKTAANEQELPFEEYVMTAVVDEINKKIEKLIWRGSTDIASSDAEYNTLHWTNGFIEIAANDDSVVDVEYSESASAYVKIKAVYNAIPEEALERGAEIYVSPAYFRAFMQDLVTANLYHYNPGNENPNEFILPGTDTKVVKTPGLAGCTDILATFPSNLYYGCDMEGDSETIDFWFSQDDRVFKLCVEWNSGMQIAFPDMVVLGTIS